MVAESFRPLTLVVAIYVSVPTVGTAQDVAADPDVVLLQFGWFPGLEASVSMEQRMVRAGQGTDSDIRISTRYHMAVSEHPLGLLVSNTEGELLGVESNVPMPSDNPLLEL